MNLRYGEHKVNEVYDYMLALAANLDIYDLQREAASSNAGTSTT